MNLRPEWPLALAAAVVAAGAGAVLVRTWRASDAAERSAHVSRVAVALLVLGIGLRPTAMHEVDVPVPSRTDLVILLDRTASMAALDADGGRSRITAAADDLVDLVIDTGGANVTVIAFDDDARVAVPATTDATAVATFLRTVGWRPSAKATGSDISVAVELASATLAQMKATDPDHQRFVVYVGDGEQTQDDTPASFAPLADHVDGALVLGYGSEKGGAMPVAPGETEQISIDGAVQVSRIDQPALQQIAEQLRGDYQHRTGPGGLPAFAESRAGTRSELQPGQEYYWWLALAAGPFLLHLLVVALRGLREAREESR